MGSLRHLIARSNQRSSGMPRLYAAVLAVMLAVLILFGLVAPSWAGLQDDHYDGNIFALYGSNGGVIPPKTTLEDSLTRKIPAVVVFYVDDSRDCKEYSAAIANLQVRYGLGVNFLAYAIDGLDLTDPQGIGRYFKGQVPQTLIFDPEGKITYQSVGSRSITEVENSIRSLFALAPVAPGKLVAQPFNEVQIGYGSVRQPKPKKTFQRTAP